MNKKIKKMKNKLNFFSKRYAAKEAFKGNRFWNI